MHVNNCTYIVNKNTFLFITILQISDFIDVQNTIVFESWKLTFPQKLHEYLLCCVISIFLTILRSEAPYLVPYLPVIPTFLVRFA